MGSDPFQQRAIKRRGVYIRPVSRPSRAAPAGRAHSLLGAGGVGGTPLVEAAPAAAPKQRRLLRHVPLAVV